ncbi:nitrite reductase (NAD(P)H) small subunit [Epidermidibacterium keratini]|uniref:Nitrite reductase (NAD(P)H) small subunit n=1 Tax=Epidermidibacterium keratini TaxID=1891644 RepID=A0A7L4YQZ9_9ACTN|nr:nitrite reductase (NAD(P)H) small subunit [Epidermidibacterium keratini]QHC01334.1 nitrite reductase (NAD(P)H) small subunit [Epidermidibacterium keratini]
MWTEICALEELRPERAVAALVGHPADGLAQVAVVLLADGSLHCVGHYDPYSKANVIARGIVGTREVSGEVIPTITSPMYKQTFDLRTGDALDDPDVGIGAWRVEVRDGTVGISGQLLPQRVGRRDG